MLVKLYHNIKKEVWRMNSAQIQLTNTCTVMSRDCIDTDRVCSSLRTCTVQAVTVFTRKCTDCISTVYNWQLVGCAYHITFYSENSVCQTLHCYPFHRHFGYSSLPVIISTVDLLRQPEVCHTHCHVIAQPGRERRKWLNTSRKS